ncbi:MAG TPA: enoyl-CoA hydratase/isomerase family protein [Pseudomonadales bacterium]|jgi:enoyl-CoA hydratase/carnithine racemase|nr:enoyl-CoA hydratase [Gammaproteobacteria bacterium]MDP6025434.1 enoyl-CoA hydratase/isomerase family protein [Pseudomonadales bacterium]MDP6316707.1 enoyl-CoA hydratase/isomerase family protein [Pseudomonadales bacterium]MDP7313467.1 enoyl-CoA hydratase/isomerase family protein [Pseudomonadales bacterium]HJL61168.1 enoyl-CoA hydratase/isomerase family protein [Pseudomonadales bacterium]|tara:strand:- start:1607 stop:2368 length:762 start_codon:yes stop_codon:yes gene_type:complete
MSIDTSVVLEERFDDVLLLTMNRPERHNALNAALNHALGSAVQQAESNGINVIVITGAGEKAFCAGGDMLEMSGVEEASGDLPPPGQRLDAGTEVAKVPLPVIAAINGYCYGGGARLAVECDIRLATQKSTFRWPGAEYGLVVGASSLPRLVGAAKAKEWIFTARKIGVDEARAEGMINAIYDEGELIPTALEMAKTIAGNSASAVRESKRVIDLASLSEDARSSESKINRVLRGSDEQSNRFRAATKKVTGR